MLLWAGCRPAVSLAASGLFINPLECDKTPCRSYLLCIPHTVPGIEWALNKCWTQTRAVDRNFSTVCVLWFYVPKNRLLIDNTMHLGPGEYLLSDCLKNETKTLCISAWLWLYSRISRRGSDHRMLSYGSQKSSVPISAGALTDLRPWTDRSLDLSEFVSSSVKWE